MLNIYPGVHGWGLQSDRKQAKMRFYYYKWTGT